MLRTLALTIEVLAFATAVHAACPSSAPYSLKLESPCREDVRSCAPQTLVTFTVLSSPGSYEIQECDSFKWEFSDGVTAFGRSSLTRSFAQPGNYRVTVTISNSLGSVKLLGHRVAIAEPPAPTFFIPPGTPRLLKEGTYAHNIVVQRLGDDFPDVSVRYQVYGVVAREHSALLPFPSGVTEQPLRVDLYDDDLAGGPFNGVTILFSEPNGGAVMKTRGFSLIVEDDEPAAVIDIPETVIVSEADGVVRIPIHTSWPLAHTVSFRYVARDGTAMNGADFIAPAPLEFPTGAFPAGLSLYHFELPLVDDDVAELPETFEVDLYEFNPSVTRSTTVTVTIRDDDGGDKRRSVRH